MSRKLFFSKTDVRRDNKTFENRASVNHGKSYEMQGWLQSFVNEVGFKLAQRLLDGAGVMP